MTKLKFLFFGLTFLLLSSCRFGNKLQDVQITSDVPRTRIYINGVEQGVTPNYVTLNKNQLYDLELKAPGYYPYKTTLSSFGFRNFEDINAKMPKTQEEYLAMRQKNSLNIPASQYSFVRTGQINNPNHFANNANSAYVSDTGSPINYTPRKINQKSAASPTTEPRQSNQPSLLGSMAGLIAEALVTTAISNYTGTNTLNAYTPTNNTGGVSPRKRKPNVTYWEPCSYCYGGIQKSGFSTSSKRCPKCFGKGKIKRVDWDAMHSL